jgi:deazaflavin-dependent oxidoreductase (nitroreductase family)
VLVELGVVEQRFQAVLEVLGGAAVTDVARRYGVARQTVHRWLTRRVAERTVTVTTDLDRHLAIDLITVGRVSGRPHTIEIWFAHLDSAIYMLSGGADRSDWVRNLIRTPAVQIHVSGHRYPGVARIVTDPEEDRLARDAVHDKYAARYFGDLTGWREAALPIAVDLDLGGAD